MAKKTIKISPEHIKLLRHKVGVTQKEASALVHVSLRQWQKFEESESSATHVRISDATLELFCLKKGLSFPPVFHVDYKHGKTLSFAGGPGGIGRSTLTRDMSLLLTQEGFDVLIITDKTGQLILAEKRYIANNTPFPKILKIEDIEWNDKPYRGMSFENIKKNYDFIFFDLEKNREHLNIAEYDIDLIITPINPPHHFDTSLRNCVNFIQSSEGKNTIVACLIVGVSHDFTFDPYTHSFDMWMSDKELRDAIENLEWGKEQQERCLKNINELKELGVYLFDTYTGDIYKYYESLHVEEKGFWATGYHFIDKPNTLSAHQMRSVKNEILRLLKVST
jgi:hypothetical protein